MDQGQHWDVRVALCWGGFRGAHLSPGSETPRAEQQGQQSSAPQQEKDLGVLQKLGVLQANHGIVAKDIQSGLGVGKFLYYLKKYIKIIKIINPLL